MAAARLRPRQGGVPALITLGSGLTGVVIAHAIGYALAFSDPHQRAHVLHDTGHGYFPAAVWAAMATGALALGATAMRNAHLSSEEARISATPRVDVLAVWQGILFLAIETSERLTAGSPLREMVHGHEVLIGLLVQVVVALVLVLLLRGAALVSARIAAAARSGRRRPTQAGRRRPVSVDVRCRLSWTTTRPRGPPLRRVVHPLTSLAY